MVLKKKKNLSSVKNIFKRNKNIVFLPQPSGPSAWRQAVKTTVKPCLKISFKLFRKEIDTE